MPTALVTGASTGIGRASALGLVSAGWTVLAGVRAQADGERLLLEAGPSLVPIELDVTAEDQIADASRLVEERTGAVGLDALINNAGIGIGGPLEIVSTELMELQFAVNVFGALAVTRALLPALRRARGRLILVSSVGGRVATPFIGPYSASKYALEAVGDVLRVELASSHIQVALIEPGSVSTPIWDKGRRAVDSVRIPEDLQSVYGHVPGAMDRALTRTAERAIAPERVAETIVAALTAPRMRSRYLVGRDAHLTVWARRLLPDLLFDRIIRRALGV